MRERPRFVLRLDPAEAQHVGLPQQDDNLDQLVGGGRLAIRGAQLPGILGCRGQR